MTTYIDSEMTPIGKFLSSDSPIRVPPFQRSYSWTDEEVKQLWSDLTEAIDSKQAEYFLGPMVVKKADDYLEIIDGQQRITTIYIILSTIRRLFLENGDNQRADWFRNRYFGEQNVVNLETEPKFHMNEVNDHIFQKYVVSDTSDAKIRSGMRGLLKKDSNYLLLQAISLIWENLQERQTEVSPDGFDRDGLLAIQSFLQENVFVLVLKVKDEADALCDF